MRSIDDLAKIEPILHTAGLLKTADQFPEDVLAAIHAANRIRATLSAPADNTQEPWPTMRVRGTPCTG